MKENIDFKAIEWLDRMADQVIGDIVDDMSIEEVKEELKGEDIEGFLTKIKDTINSFKESKKTSKQTNKIKETISNLIEWVSPIWELELEPSTASNIDEQKKTFYVNDGYIHITCDWESECENNPAHIDIKWNSDITQFEFYARFINPTTNEILSELLLGEEAGEQHFSEKALGFNPSSDKWALSIVLK